MQSTRKDILVPARIGSVEFIAIGASGSRPRRIIRHGAVGMDGQALEDLGEDARTDEITAILTEAQWIELDALRRQGRVVSIVHPLFGSYQGRIVDCPYRAGFQDHVETTITVIEDGAHMPGPPPRVSPSATAAKLRAEADILSDILADAPEETEADFLALGTAATDLVSAAGSMADLLDAGITMAGVAWHAATAAYDAVTEAVSDVADAGRQFVGIVSDGMDTALAAVDQAWTIAARGRDCLDAIVSSIASAWSEVTVSSIRSLDAILRETLGDVSDDLIAQVLAANPDITDPLMISPGITLRIPRGTT